MKVLVTGGAGYLGYALIERLHLILGTELEELVLFDNFARSSYALFASPPDVELRLRLNRADILDDRALRRALEGIDVVYHLAAHVRTPNADSESVVFDQVNNWGSSQVARAIEQSDSVQTVIHVSSTAVYGSADRAVTEADFPRPSTAYGISKLQGESHVERLAATGRKVFVVRSGNLYGFNPAMRFDAVVNRFVFDGKFVGRLLVEGDGSQTRSFIHVDRLARTLALIPVLSVDGGLYNASEHNLTIAGVARSLAQLLPQVEILSVHRDARMKSFAVSLPSALVSVADLEPADFEEDLRDLVHQIGPRSLVDR